MAEPKNVSDLLDAVIKRYSVGGEFGKGQIADL